MGKSTPNNSEENSDTIFALATASGRAGVAIVRISGPKSETILENLTRRKSPAERTAKLRILKDVSGKHIDQALVLLFNKPDSVTGENMAELHTHGSVAVIDALSKTLYEMGLRQAKPGEFTRRAFENGRLDLTEVEGLSDLIDSESEGQRRQALRQMEGGLKQIYEGWRTKILDALAMVEGEIDFPDEGDVPSSLAHQAGSNLTELTKELKNTLANSKRGEKVRSGIEIAIIGAPNAGKSSILNRLARRDVAIVSKEAGTTRDIIEVHLQMAGLPVKIFDTAGLRKAENTIEAEGVRRAKKRAQNADLCLGVIDLTKDNNEVLDALNARDFILYNKLDLDNTKVPENVSRETFFLSAKTGLGFEVLETRLEEEIKTRFMLTEQAGLTRSRHKQCVNKALLAIENATNNLAIAPELTGADLREALHAIKELAGETDIEAVLDRVFAQFCIGK